LTLRRDAPPDFVEEIHHNLDVILRFSWLGALRRHQHDEALAVGGEIEVPAHADSRKLLSGPQPRLVRHKRFPLHSVRRHHDPPVLSAVEQLMSTSRPYWPRPTGVGNLHLGAIIRKGPHVHFVTATFGVPIGQPSSVGREGRERVASRRFEEQPRLAGPHLAGTALHRRGSDFTPSPASQFGKDQPRAMGSEGSWCLLALALRQRLWFARPVRPCPEHTTSG